MSLELKSFWEHPFGSLFHKVEVLGKNLSYWNFLHTKRKQSKMSIIQPPGCSKLGLGCNDLNG